VLLCPPVFCLPLDATRLAMTDTEYREHVRDAGLMLAWDYRGPGDDSPLEPKANDWGWLDGRPVAVDYANLE
jgi:hypothetical protein